MANLDIKVTCQTECLCIANGGARPHPRWQSYLVYQLVVHQAQLKQPTGYYSSHIFAKTQELMGATKTPAIIKSSVLRGTHKLLCYLEIYFCESRSKQYIKKGSRNAGSIQRTG